MKSSVCANGVSARMIFRKRDGEDELTAVHVPADQGDESSGEEGSSGSSDGQETATATDEQPAATSEAT